MEKTRQIGRLNSAFSRSSLGFVIRSNVFPQLQHQAISYTTVEQFLIATEDECDTFSHYGDVRFNLHVSPFIIEVPMDSIFLLGNP
jgi:hypothetical protein